MNQILINYKSNESRKSNYKKNFLKNKSSLYLTIFIFLILLSIALIFYIIYTKYEQYLKTQTSKQLISKYNISSIYSSNSSNTAIKLSNSVSIIGLIEIPKINISYPILSQSNKELLKISICRFSGPFPNNTGNMCLAGHNYKNSLMFSNLDKLNISDIIYISDLNQNKKQYIIYNKYIVNGEDSSCTSESSDTEITLITCSKTNNNKRIIVKAKMKES